jgi:predicted permease
MDFSVFAYLTAISVGTSLLFGLAPALQLSKLDIIDALKEGGRGSAGGRRTRWFSAALVVTQITLAMVLLAGAGLMIRSFLKLYEMHSVMDAASALVMRLNLLDAKYPKPEDRLSFYDRLRPRLKSVPGVEQVAIASHLPIAGSFSWRFELEGQPPVEDEKRASVSGVVISPEYFQAVGVPLLRGRAFTESDGLAGKESAIVNQRFANQYWPGQEPLGKRVRLLKQGQPQQPWLTVVAVSPDLRQNDPNRAEVTAVIYVPYRQDASRSMGVIARTRVTPASLASAFRKELQQLDRDMPAFTLQPLTTMFEQQRWGLRVFGTLFVVFAVIALVLSAVGIYAVVAYSVSRRTQEIGVRMALGATGRGVLAMVLWQGLRQLAIGLVLGLAAALAVTRVLSGILVQVKANDPVTFASIGGLLAAVSVVACWMPARRAMRVDPVVALRHE